MLPNDATGHVCEHVRRHVGGHTESNQTESNHVIESEHGPYMSTCAQTWAYLSCGHSCLRRMVRCSPRRQGDLLCLLATPSMQPTPNRHSLRKMPGSSMPQSRPTPDRPALLSLFITSQACICAWHTHICAHICARGIHTSVRVAYTYPCA